MNMAGIVASTLRRRTFRHKLSIDARYQSIEPGHVSLSPTAVQALSRSASFRQSFSKSPAVPRAVYVPKGAKLFHEDFWPTCINPAEPNLKEVEFESFDTLVPKANSWLRDNLDILLVKCETLEKKVVSVDQVASDCVMFVPNNDTALYVKGLRLWFVYSSDCSKCALQNISPTAIGYMNVIPKCLDSSTKYPVFENLPETYAAINTYLVNSPLEGKILTIETVPLKLPRRLWTGPEVDPDQTFFPDEYLRHVLYITRIYFIYGAPEDELIGAQDFLPDFIQVPKCYSIYSSYPRYRPMASAMHKAKEWIQAARNIRITNIQTLEAVFRKQPGNVHTGVNFIDKVECCVMVRFVRITYVRPLDESVSCRTMYSPPVGLSYKTFIPAAVKVGMCSGAPQYESFAATWERSKAWLKCVERRVVSAESFYHPMQCIWHGQDGAEATVMQGEWTASDRKGRQHKHQRQLVQIVRVYLDGDYREPSPHHLPPSPMVEEINDCLCSIM